VTLLSKISIEIASAPEMAVPQWLRKELVGIKIPASLVIERVGWYSISAGVLVQELSQKSPSAGDCLKGYVEPKNPSFNIPVACCKLVPTVPA
jgi:hypothetical protein